MNKQVLSWINKFFFSIRSLSMFVIVIIFLTFRSYSNGPIMENENLLRLFRRRKDIKRILFLIMYYSSVYRKVKKYRTKKIIIFEYFYVLSIILIIIISILRYYYLTSFHPIHFYRAAQNIFIISRKLFEYPFHKMHD